MLLFTILEIYQGDARKQILKIQSITVFIFCLSNFFCLKLFSKMFVLCEILTERNESASANGLKRIQSVNTVTAGGSSTSHRQTDRLELNVTF